MCLIEEEKWRKEVLGLHQHTFNFIIHSKQNWIFITVFRDLWPSRVGLEVMLFNNLAFRMSMPWYFDL